MQEKKIILKYGKLTYEILIQESQTIQSFQSKIYSLTTVPPKNMRILNKSHQIKDENTLHNLKQGTVLTIFGTKQSNVIQKIQSKIQNPKQSQIIPKKPNNSKLKGYHGLINVGNTCYINSVIQFLKVIPQLKTWILATKIQQLNEGILINLFADIFREMENKKCNPYIFVQNFLHFYQQFGPYGQQQDAQEFLQKMLGLFQKFGNIKVGLGKNENKIKNLFEIEYQQVIRNTQLKDEQIKIIKHCDFEMRCVFGDSQNIVRTLQDGIRENLQNIIEKKSEINGKVYKYQKSSQIKRLPEYLIVQLVRFYWKQSGQYWKTQPRSAKICKIIQFQQKLDLFDFCTEDLKIQLRKGREKKKQNYLNLQKQQKQKFLEYKTNPLNINKHIDESEILREFRIASKSQSIAKLDLQLYKEHGTGIQTGEFSLISLITHRGQTLKGGHYMAWSRRSGNDWIKFNDQLFKQKKSDDLINIRGGLPNSQMVYMLLYRRQQA